jgi:hypothetical protein
MTTGRVLPCTITAGPEAALSGRAAAAMPAAAVVAMKSRRLSLRDIRAPFGIQSEVRSQKFEVQRAR